MRKPAAIYARVSSDRQKENHTLASQTTALIQHAETQGYAVPSEWVFQDERATVPRRERLWRQKTCRLAQLVDSKESGFSGEGYSGASLVRPGLEALRIWRRKDTSRRCGCIRRIVSAESTPIRFCWRRSSTVKVSNWFFSRLLPAPRRKISWWCSFRA